MARSEDHPAETRVFALNLLRCLGTLLIFLFHFKGTMGRTSFVGRAGWSAVELFFVLTGYLITQQVMRQVALGQFKLGLFYMRRALRIWPSYIVILALYYFLPSLAEGSVLPVWQFLSFTANFFHPEGTFVHAWTLCIDEQFYFLLPLITLLVWSWRRRTLVWPTLVALVIGGMMARYWIYENYVAGFPEGYVQAFRDHFNFPTYLHLDGLCFGVAIALLKDHAVWPRLLKSTNVILGLGLFLFAGCFLFLHSRIALGTVVVGQPLFALAYALIVLAALGPASWLNRFEIPGIDFLAGMSYSFYLVHRPIVTWLARHGEKSFPLALVASLAGALILYFAVEKPFLVLRERLSQKPAVAPASELLSA